MITIPAAIDVPLHRDERGNIRVGSTRVLLELVIHAFNAGETPEGIVDSYSTLTLTDVYAVVTYYLTHRAEVDAYVQQQNEKAEAVLREVEANALPEILALRARLKEKQRSES